MFPRLPLPLLMHACSNPVASSSAASFRVCHARNYISHGHLPRPRKSGRKCPIISMICLSTKPEQFAGGTLHGAQKCSLPNLPRAI